MSLRRFTTAVDGTIPIQALLYDDEELLASQDGVGIYIGNQKSPEHQSGTTHVSSHRLFYIDLQSHSFDNSLSARSNSFNSQSLDHSFSLDLNQIIRTDFYSGLLRSSAKVTLYLTTNTETGGAAAESWECQVCAFKNPPGLSRLCSLCGVPRAVTEAQSPVSISQTKPESVSHLLAPEPPLSSSLPSSSSSNTVSCPACTFLNHPSLQECEICGSALPSRASGPSSRMAPSLKSAPSSRPPSPEDEDFRSIKISFRKGGEKPFYAVLRRSIKTQAWGQKGQQKGQQKDGEMQKDAVRSGISGILRDVDRSVQGRESDMTDAFKDLEAFMVKAKEMVRLAAELNERLTAATSTPSASNTSSEPEEATFIRSSLSQLGLQMSNTPVTQDMIKDERKWTEELARELAGVLGIIMKDRGIIALDEVWGAWNRARGVALIPPSTFLQVLPYLPIYTNPTISVRSLGTGTLKVLHTPPYSEAAFAARLSGFLTVSGPCTTLEIAHAEAVTVALAEEMVLTVERDGGISRDDSGCSILGKGNGTSQSGGVGYGEIRWWPNMFETVSWDGQP
ncbi:EAP30/Vps36 family-domain-containing protein [Mycena floridula]|nr:EAP30/Vps36 family-domain-containing protein [Mycena floridula]